MLKVLQSTSQIAAARHAMKRRGWSVLEHPVARTLRRIGVGHGLPVGDVIKSWDVEQTLDFIAAHLSREAPILDLGAYCSEVPVALARMGYQAVCGVDLNPALGTMPHADRVRYEVSNFMATPYEDACFGAITATSVIEHGYQPERLFAEVARLLRSGGYFLASFDYWPEKIDTGTTTFFGMSWLIFSRQDVEELLRIAASHGLRPVGELKMDAQERAVHCIGYDYTFAWLALRKD